METLGQRLKTARKAKGLTLEQLAALVGLRQPTISRLERGSTQSSSSILTIAKALDIDPMWLQFGEGKDLKPVEAERLNTSHNAHKYVRKAIKDGYLARVSELLCVDCGAPAKVYDHRDYNRPLDVEPVCNGCNIKRGPAIPFVHINDR